MKFDNRVQQRFQDIADYLVKMQNERAGWGPEPQTEVADTAISFARAMATLAGAEEVWADGQMSFSGRMPGGIYFGMICSKMPITEDWEYPALRWTFHS